MVVAARGEYLLWSPGRANPRQPGSSPSGPSVRFTRRTRNVRTAADTEATVTDETSPPAAVFSPAVRRWTVRGRPRATRYQNQRTRQRTNREPSSRSPAQPRVSGITMSAATNGPNAPKEPNGTNAQATA